MEYYPKSHFRVYRNKQKIVITFTTCQVLVGTNDISYDSKRSPPSFGEIFEIDDWVHHGKFVGEGTEGPDISILKLKTGVDLARYPPACLANKPQAEPTRVWHYGNNVTRLESLQLRIEMFYKKIISEFFIPSPMSQLKLSDRRIE